MSDAPTSAATILFVCTANVCRSPYMEYRLRELLRDRDVSDLPITSAGTRALEGHPMDDIIAHRLGDQGVDVTGFRAARLTSETVQQAGIVVTATREHRSQVVRFGNDLAERTFTLAQLARLLSVDPSVSGEGGADGQIMTATGLASAAVAARGRRATGAMVDDDLDDPWQRSRRRYRRVADRIDELLRPIADRLVARG